MDFLDGYTLISEVVYAVCFLVPFLPDDLSDGLSERGAGSVIGWFCILSFIIWLIIVICTAEDDKSITLRKKWSYKICFYFLVASSMIQGCLWKWEQVSNFIWLVTITVLMNEIARHFLMWIKEIRNHD